MYKSVTALLAASAFLLSTTASPVPATTETTSCEIVDTYTVVAGDGLFNIATSYNVTVDQVMFVNPGITNARFIDIGQVISIPDSSCEVPASETTIPAVEPTATCSNGTETTYTVVSGDTMTIIAKEKLGITLQALVDANPQITDIDVLNIGDVLNIPLCTVSKKRRAAVHYERSFTIDGKINFNGTATAKDAEDLKKLQLGSAKLV